MPKKSLIIIFLAVFGVLAWQNCAQAGFGISPPYVKSDKIVPGSHYEQKITLLRSSADDDLQAQITVDAPTIASWITLDPGTTFDLPRGQLQVPMIVKVDAPKDAALGNYTGHINIRISPKAGNNQAGVSIALGARVDIDLTVTNETFSDFLIRAVNIPNLEMLGAPWRWPIFSWFFYRVKLTMKIENTGNVKVSPSKVHLDVYDLTEKNLLESHDDTHLEKVDPYTTKEITATFPTKLGEGQYWGKINIYKGNEVIRNDKLIFTISPKGSLGLGTASLGIWPWLMLGGMVLLCLIFIFVLIKIRIWRYIFKLLYILSWPLRYAGEKIKALGVYLKLKFWRWIHQKSAKYQTSENSDPVRPNPAIDLKKLNNGRTGNTYKR